MDKEMQTLTWRIRSAQGPAEKASIMREMGDTRYDRYKMTGDPREKQLASTCYLAARNFFYKNTQATARQALGTGIRY
jgi:hypothetical protein